MFRHVPRACNGLVHSSRTHRIRYSTSSLSSTIKIQHVPAPHAGSITVLSLNRPKSRNALSRQLLSELNELIEGLHAEKATGYTKALIIASESDHAFCAGADLKERVAMQPAEVQDFLRMLRDTYTRLSTLPIPTISAIGSTALGGGLELALCTHFRVLASTASVGLPETKVGILPGAGGTYRLPALIGLNRARDLVLTGRRVAAPEAYFLGLADRLVEITEDEVDAPGVARGKVLEHAIALARDICDGGPIATKAALLATTNWEQGEASENAAYDLVMHTEDRMEGLRAFAEKRKPHFKGR